MKCDKCGNINEDYAQYCDKCGAALNYNIIPNNKKRVSPLIIILIAIMAVFVLIGGVTAYIVYFDTSPVEVFDLNSNSGDVLDNSEIASNVNNSNISSVILAKTKSSTPVYKIGDGSGPVTVVSAGVHGDQLVPSIAAMRLINYLDERKINGTVYVIPFVSPGAVSKNTKLSDGVNLNTVADESGTASNDVVKLAMENNASAVGDFHETEVGKNPGYTTIMCSQVPNYHSYELANDMSKLSLDTTLTYLVAGVSYDGAVEDVLNLNGTAAVTPLVVVSSHGVVSNSAVDESYNQMLALLLVNGNLNPDDDYLKLANADIDGL